MYLSFPLSDDFLALVLAWPDSIDPIYRMYNVVEIFTLNVFSTDSKPDMPLLSFFVGGCHGPRMYFHIFHVKFILSDFLDSV